MKKITIILIILASMTLLSALNTAVAPKLIYIQLTMEGSYPPEGTVTFQVFKNDNNLINLTSTDHESCYYTILPEEGIGLIVADLAVLKNSNTYASYQWQVNDEFRILITYSYSREFGDITIYHTITGTELLEYANDADIIPLAVTLSSFTAVYQNGNSVLQWQTASESSNSGWNVYRSETEMQEDVLKVNPELIPGHGTTTEPQNYIFEDTEVETGTTCYYWLESLDYSGSNQTYGPIELQIPENGGETPPPVNIVYGLHNAYPNPFNPETTISFIMEQPGNAELAIYNIKGQKVITLYDNFVNKVDETVSIHWDGKDASGKVTGSGIYFYQFKTTGRTQIKKMVLVK